MVRVLIRPGTGTLSIAKQVAEALEIYVRRYPALDRQWQVSAGGGVQA